MRALRREPVKVMRWEYWRRDCLKRGVVLWRKGRCVG